MFSTLIFLFNILLSPQGTASKCLEAVEKHNVLLFTSRDTLTELRDVLIRPNILSRLPEITTKQVEFFVGYISDISELIDPISHEFVFERDPKDEIFIDLAIKAGADFIVTGDKDMLDLMTGYTIECKEFRRRFRQLKIISPLEFLAVLEAI